MKKTRPIFFVVALFVFVATGVALADGWTAPSAGATSTEYLSTIYCELAGCTMSGNITMGDNDIIGAGDVDTDTLTLENGEQIDNPSDGIVRIVGVGGSSNEILEIDLESNDGIITFESGSFGNFLEFNLMSIAVDKNSGVYFDGPTGDTRIVATSSEELQFWRANSKKFEVNGAGILLSDSVDCDGLTDCFIVDGDGDTTITSDGFDDRIRLQVGNNVRAEFMNEEVRFSSTTQINMNNGYIYDSSGELMIGASCTDTNGIGTGDLMVCLDAEIDGTLYADGNITAAADITSSDTGDIGWSVQTGADTACSTTCTFACVFGQDTGTGNIVDCSDATADRCVCAGAS